MSLYFGSGLRSDLNTLKHRGRHRKSEEMARSSSSTKDGESFLALFHSLRSAYAATPTNLKVCFCLSLGITYICLHFQFRCLNLNAVPIL